MVGGLTVTIYELMARKDRESIKNALLGIVPDNSIADSKLISTGIKATVAANVVALAQNTLQTDIKGTTQTVTLDTNGNVIKLQHINGSAVVIREDDFDYSVLNLITEVRTIIASGLTMTYKYHLDTLNTEVI